MRLGRTVQTVREGSSRTTARVSQRAKGFGDALERGWDFDVDPTANGRCMEVDSILEIEHKMGGERNIFD
jgi:hypothetical protein